MQKNVVLTLEQIRRFKRRIIKESFVVNTELVKEIRDFVDKAYTYKVYDDIDDNGDSVQKIVIQLLSTNGEPLQSITPEKVLGKLDAKYANKIKDNKERKEFIRQVLKDWINGKITKEGLLSVNSIGK